MSAGSTGHAENVAVCRHRAVGLLELSRRVRNFRRKLVLGGESSLPAVVAKIEFGQMQSENAGLE